MLGQPYVGLPVFRITPVGGEGKVKIVHQNLLLPFEGNIEEDSENEGNWQGVDGPPDCILAVSDDGLSGTEAVSTDPEPMDEGDAICVQCVQTNYKPNYWVKTIWDGWNLYIATNNVKLLHRDLPMSVLWSISYPR